MIRARRLSLLLLAAGVAAVACGRKKAGTPTLTIDHLHIRLQFPVYGETSSFDLACANTKALLLSFDTGNGSGWDYRVLTDLNGNLYGCGGLASTPCAVNQVRFGLQSSLRRIMVEGIDVDPAGYDGSPGFNVDCRGLAGQNEPGTLNLTTTTAQAAVPMLRVGDVNGLFSTLGPSLYWPAGGAANGDVIVAGGELPDPGITPTQSAEAWRFDATKIAFSPETALSVARSRLRATEIPRWQNNGEAVVFSGGISGSLGADSTAIDVYQAATVAPVSGNLRAKTAMHAAAFAPVSWAGQGGAVVLAGGCPLPSDDGLISDFAQFILPSYPQNGAPGFLTCQGLQGGNTSEGNPAVCSDDTGTADHVMQSPGYCHLDAVPQQITGAGLRLWLPGGGRTGNVAGDVFTNLMGLYDPATGVFSYQTNFPSDDFRETATVALDQQHALALGGLIAGSSNKQALLESDGTFANLTTGGSLSVSRGAETATLLPDGSILVTGGFDPPDALDDVELVTFTPGPPPQVTAAAARRIDGSKVKLMFPRSHHVAVAIRNSGTWLDGAVVIAGSASGVGELPVPPELYVPAVACSAGSNNVCDRGILPANEPLTDPTVKNPPRLP